MQGRCIVRMRIEGNSNRGKSPRILNFWVERNRVPLDRQGRSVGEKHHRARVICLQSGLVFAAPLRQVLWHTVKSKARRIVVETGVDGASTVKAPLRIGTVIVMNESRNLNTFVLV